MAVWQETYVGLTELKLGDEVFDLGRGVTLRKTYTHVMAHVVLAFAPPDKPGQHHPGPWKAAPGGYWFDVECELYIPSSVERDANEQALLAKTIVFLLKLWVNSAVMLRVFANHPFSELKDMPEKELGIAPYETLPRHFALAMNDDEPVIEKLWWVRDHWEAAHRLASSNKVFALAAEAMNSGQFIQNTALTMVSIWAALEALFCDGTTEVTFRVSSLLAAYLEPPGAQRAELQKRASKLYGHRSKAAHGVPKHQAEDLLESFVLLRRALIRIIEVGHAPTRKELEDRLFGVVVDEGLKAPPSTLECP